MKILKALFIAVIILQLQSCKKKNLIDSNEVYIGTWINSDCASLKSVTLQITNENKATYRNESCGSVDCYWKIENENVEYRKNTIYIKHLKLMIIEEPVKLANLQFIGCTGKYSQFKMILKESGTWLTSKNAAPLIMRPRNEYTFYKVN